MQGWLYEVRVSNASSSAGFVLVIFILLMVVMHDLYPSLLMYCGLWGLIVSEESQLCDLVPVPQPTSSLPSLDTWKRTVTSCKGKIINTWNVLKGIVWKTKKEPERGAWERSSNPTPFPSLTHLANHCVKWVLVVCFGKSQKYQNNSTIGTGVSDIFRQTPTST